MRRALILAVIAVLALPATALGATRYAAPNGAAAGSCTDAAPCSLTFAITAAAEGDEVIVTAGTYSVASPIEATVPLTIRGVGPSLSRIVGTKEITPLKAEKRVTLANLAIASTESSLGTVFAPADGSIFDHLELTANGASALALRPGVNWTMTDSLLVAKGESATGFFIQGVANGTATVHNATVIAEGKGSIAMGVAGVAPVAPTLQAANVIAIGETAAETLDSKGSIASISVDHSDLQGKVTGRVVQAFPVTAPPVFVDAAAGDYREGAGSPTIDAGANETADGTTDLIGNPRTLPGSITCPPTPQPAAVADIGAFEFVPARPLCPVTPAAVPQTTLGKATIKGRKAKFRFRATGGVATGFRCKLDRKPWRKCASPRTYKHLKPGRHAFRVRAVGAGGVDATPALRKFRIQRPRAHRHGVG